MRIYLLYLFFLCVVSLLFTSCTENKNPSKKNNLPDEQSDTVAIQYRKPPSGYGDTLHITGKAAVFFYPDTLQLEKIKKMLGKTRFESDHHECYYQVRNAQIVLKQYRADVSIIETNMARYLLFSKDLDKPVFIDLDKRNEMCGLYLFKQGKAPVFADMTNIESELNFYFQ